MTELTFRLSTSHATVLFVSGVVWLNSIQNVPLSNPYVYSTVSYQQEFTQWHRIQYINSTGAMCKIELTMTK